MGLRSDLKRSIVYLVLCGLVFTLLGAGVRAVTAKETTAGHLESYVELLRSDIRTKRMALVADNMYLTKDEATVFWPIYRKYDAERTDVNDERLAIIREYIENYKTMSDLKALELSGRWLDAEADQLRVRKKYLEEFSDELPGRVVARFFQVDRRIDLLIEVQAASDLPMVE